MRVVFGHRTRATGAEGVHIRGLIGGLRQLGHQVDVLSPYDITFDDGPTQRAPAPARANGHPQRRPALSHALFRVLSQRAPEFVFELAEIAYNGYSLPRIYRTLRQRRPALYYERYSLFHFAGVLAARMCGVPAILEVNDSALIERSRPLFFRRLAVWFEARILRAATNVVTVSGPFRDGLAAHGAAVAARTVVIPNAIDPDRFRRALDPDERRALAQEVRARLGIGDRRVLGVSGAFVPWHGLDFLVTAVAELLKRDDLHLLLVGDGPVRARIERLAAEKGVADRVTFTGFVSPDEVVRYLTVFDIGLMPNSNRHGSPMKIFEYLAMGVPVVAADYAPIAEVITSGETGLLFEPLDAAELRSAVVRLLGDAALRARLAARGRELVYRNHTWTRVAERTLSLLQSSRLKSH
ncbi:MAG: glycosyltransferase family 4 protein [Burkholderiaceae bacterium]|nr:glycosyltransferase family 4 protein [Burkholderiaceae bacterium]